MGFSIFGSFRDFLLRLGARTGTPTTFIHRLLQVYILEMEDVLFHLDSAVMMPERPGGASSSQGVGDDASDASTQQQQDQVSGLAAIALGLKQFEFDPNKRLLIAGHADTSGQAKMNFELSALRAQNVEFLVEGDREKWAKVSESRHRIEDYQQIMKFVKENTRWGWNCDPGAINNQWNTATRDATKNFIEAYNTWVLAAQAPTEAVVIPQNTISIISNSGAHKWPIEMWRAVYDIYNDEIAASLGVPRGQIGRYRSLVMYAEDAKRLVACGESFPLDNAGRDNYRSQLNRRVEMLFFDKEEIPVLNCPTRTTSIHTPAECPLWHKWHFAAVHIDPADLTATAYHLKFTYFDRVHQAIKPVPEGLQIKVFENFTTEIPARVTYSNGVYMVKVQNNTVRTDIHFTFASTNQWLFSADDKTEPVFVTKTPDEIKALTWLERIKYYDIPAEWSSRNYFTRYDNTNPNTGDRFIDVLRTHKQLKPYGGNTTDPNQPLTFSLDDIVLGDANRSQGIRDRNAANTLINLDANSRYALFYIDHTTNETVAGTTKNLRKLAIHNPDPNLPIVTNQAFSVNFITDVPGNARIVYFCNGFYDIYDKRSRSTDPGFNLTANHVLGARLALLTDGDVHVTQTMIGSSASDRAKGYTLSDLNPAIGHYTLHYFHNCDILDGKPLYYLLTHWDCRLNFQAPATAADVNNHRHPGFKNANERMNRKNYLFERKSGTHDILIRPYYYMEVKNDTNGGAHKAMVTIVQSGSWMLPDSGNFRQAAYQAEPNRFASPDPDNTKQDLDGNTNEPLANSHEMGHALGNADEYLYSADDAGGNSWGGLPDYTQVNTAEGGPYAFDKSALMNRNRAWRARHLWKNICWLHDESAATKSLNKFFSGTRFRINLPGPSTTLLYDLADTYKNIHYPAKRGDNLDMGSNAKVDALLYKLDDETAHLVKSGLILTSILAIRTKFAIRFVDVGANTWTTATKRTWAVTLNSDYKAMVDLKFRLSCPPTNDFQETLCTFNPHFKEYTGGDPGDSHINIRVKAQTGGGFTISGNRLEVDRDVNTARIIRFCFGLTAGTAALANTNFGPIVTWMSGATVANGTFTMNNL